MRKRANHSGAIHAVNAKHSNANANLPFLLRLHSGDIPTGKHHYTGVAHDLQERLSTHNAGHAPHTSKFALWYRETDVAFVTRKKLHTNAILKQAPAEPASLNILYSLATTLPG